ncbi:hypothetical protein [Streptomyces sp. B6B3]|uniref:DUF3817 domain-containing protein n=1 Tax=Streptomyces sp. B6B3 TaxID=3153570 RepID=UPI00325E6A7E
MRALRLAAVVEAGSLVVLLANLATVHVPAVASLVGPVHGMAYLVAIATAPPGARWRAVIPGIGGLLAARRAGARVSAV